MSPEWIHPGLILIVGAWLLPFLKGNAKRVAMLAVAEGASEEAQEQIRQLGSTNVILRSVKPPEDLVSNQTTRVLAYGLTNEDLARIKGTYPGLRAVVPVLETPQEVRNGRRTVPKAWCGAGTSAPRRPA